MTIKKLVILVLLLLQVSWLGVGTHAYTEADPLTFHQYNYGQGVHVLNSDEYFAIPSDPTYFALYIPNIVYIQDRVLVYPAGSSTLQYVSARLFLWDDDFSNMHYIDMIDLREHQEVFGTYSLDEPTLQSFNIHLYRWGYFTLLAVYEGETRTDLLDWLNARIRVKFNDEIGSPVATGMLVTYVDRENVYYATRHTVGGVPDLPPPPRQPYMTFFGWRDVDGYMYDFDEALDPDLPEGDFATLFATWQFVAGGGAGSEPVIDPLVPAVNIFNTTLGVLGLNNTAGRILFYVLMTVVFILMLAFIKTPPFVTVIVMAVFTGFAIFLGWLPVYVMILAGMALIVILLMLIKGGATA